jgi:hypothetical protein
MKPFVFSTTKSIINEIGAVERIANICSTLDISKPLIITDQGIVDVGLMQPLDAAFKKAGKAYLCFDRDGLVNLAGGKATVKAIPNAKLKIYPGMGHDFPVELIPNIIDDIVAHVNTNNGERT